MVKFNIVEISNSQKYMELFLDSRLRGNDTLREFVIPAEAGIQYLQGFS
jgi:hypothetical protein